MIRTCKFCEKEIDDLGVSQRFSAHCRNCELNPNKHIAKENTLNTFEQKRIAKRGTLKVYDLVCFNCNSNFKKEIRELEFDGNKKYFCSQRCATKYSISCLDKTTKKSCKCKYCGDELIVHKNSSNTKISCKLCKKKYKNIFYKHECKECNTKFTSSTINRIFCSVTCKNKNLGRKGGKISASKRVLRSANEVKFFDIIKNKIDCVESNKIIANGWDADIVIEKYKIAILWNGPWHYKQLNIKNHSVKQVQNRDLIKLKLFSELGWDVLIFEDRYWGPDSAAEQVFKYIDLLNRFNTFA